jgi:hypothetical protein
VKQKKQEIILFKKGIEENDKPVTRQNSSLEQIESHFRLNFPTIIITA